MDRGSGELQSMGHKESKQLRIHVCRHSTGLDAGTPICVASVMRNLAQMFPFSLPKTNLNSYM